MNATALRLASSPTPVERLRARQAEARAEAADIARGVLARAAAVAQELRELEVIRHDLTPCVSHDAPLLADKIGADVERMVASLRGAEGRIR